MSGENGARTAAHVHEKLKREEETETGTRAHDADAFDARLRETYMVWLHVLLSFVAGFAMLARVAAVSPAGAQHAMTMTTSTTTMGLPTRVLAVVALGLAASAAAATVVCDVLSTFPAVARFLDVDAARLVAALWTTTTHAALVAVLVMMPFAALLAEAPRDLPLRERLFLTALEVGLSVALLAGSALLFVRPDVVQTARVSMISVNVAAAVDQTITLLVALPGAFAFAWEAPRGVARNVRAALDDMVPWHGSAARAAIESRLVLLRLGFVAAGDKEPQTPSVAVVLVDPSKTQTRHAMRVARGLSTPHASASPGSVASVAMQAEIRALERTLSASPWLRNSTAACRAGGWILAAVCATVGAVVGPFTPPAAMRFLEDWGLPAVPLGVVAAAHASRLLAEAALIHAAVDATLTRVRDAGFADAGPHLQFTACAVLIAESLAGPLVLFCGGLAAPASVVSLAHLLGVRGLAHAASSPPDSVSTPTWIVVRLVGAAFAWRVSRAWRSSRALFSSRRR